MLMQRRGRVFEIATKSSCASRLITDTDSSGPSSDISDSDCECDITAPFERREFRITTRGVGILFIFAES